MISTGLRCAGYGWMPIVAATSLLIGIVVPYFISVRLDHVYPILPNISDTGALHPENCVFGQMLNITSALFFAMVYIRHRQVKQYKDGPKDLPELNTVSCSFGYLAAAGLSLVGNVQIDVHSATSVETHVHLFGAGVGFSGGIFYGFTQSWITYTMATDVWSRAVALVRFTLSCIAAFFTITFLVFRQLAYAEFNGTYFQTLQWNPNDGGYVYHVYSSASEYLLGFTFLVLILFMYKDLKTITPHEQETIKEMEVKGYIMAARDPLA